MSIAQEPVKVNIPRETVDYSFDFEDEIIMVRLPRKNKHEAWNAAKQAIDILIGNPKKTAIDTVSN